MKIKDFTKKIIVLSFAFSLVFLACDSTSHASTTNRKDLMHYGLQKINRETFNLRDMKEERFNKLENDLDDVLETGVDNADINSYFYLTNNLPFTSKELEYGLQDTGLKGLGKDFKEVSEKYGINPLLLMAMAKHETGNGTSDLFLEKNNLFGFNAIDHDPYNMASDFKEPKESIETVAKHLKEEYLSKDGTYFNGVSAKGIGTRYASDPDWSKKVNSMMIEIADKMIESYKAGE